MPFGKLIADARKKAGLSQKDLAAKIHKEDGEAISPQYLNDLERDRRNPPSEHLLRQFASLLGLDEDIVFFQAGQYPSDLRDGTHQSERLQAAFSAFRRELRGSR